MSGPSGEVTRLLAQRRDGHPEAGELLFPLVCNDLRRLAGASMRHERPAHTLQATALVHEAYIRLTGCDPAQNRPHFLAIAAHTMRRVLLDYARQHNAEKRGSSPARVDFDAKLMVAPDVLDRIVAIDEALERLAKVDPRQSKIVELRFFGGLSMDDAGDLMGISATTVKREWRLAKAWLQRELASIG